MKQPKFCRICDKTSGKKMGDERRRRQRDRDIKVATTDGFDFLRRQQMLHSAMGVQLESSYQPRGGQGQAIAKLIKSVEADNRHQTLLGVTGSGKTFSVANVIQELDRPTLVISHNKTLAAQLYSEFKQFFPRNAVEYFVSYFDYYQPEAYIPRSDTYIEKDSSINEEIERLRLSTASALL